MNKIVISGLSKTTKKNRKTNWNKQNQTRKKQNKTNNKISNFNRNNNKESE